MLVLLCGLIPAAAQRQQSPSDQGRSPGPSRSVEVKGVRFWSHQDYIRVVVDLEAAVRYKFDRLSDPERLYFDLYDTRIGPELAARQIAVGDAGLNRIRIAQTQDSVTRVVFDLNAGVSPRVFVLDDPPRLVVDLKGESGAGQMAEATPKLSAAPNSALAIASRILKAKPVGAADAPREKSTLQPNAPVKLGSAGPPVATPTLSPNAPAGPGSAGPQAAKSALQPSAPAESGPASGVSPPAFEPTSKPFKPVMTPHGVQIPKGSRAPKLEEFLNGTQREAEAVVSVGCGCTGNLAAWPAAIKIAVDPLLYVNQKLDMLIEDAPNISCTLYLSVGVGDTSLLDKYAGMVICRNALDHMSDPGEGLSQIRRILKNNQLLFLSVDIGGAPTPDEPSPFTRESFSSLLQDHFEIVSERDGQPPHDEWRDCSFRILAQKKVHTTPVLSKERILDAYEAHITETVPVMDGGCRFTRGEKVRRNAWISIQFHGATHRRFSTLDGAEQEWKLGDSKAALEAHIGEAVTLFSFPYCDDGSDAAQTRLALLRTGHRAACLYQGGVMTAPPADPYRLQRLAIGTDTALGKVLLAAV